MINMSNDSIQYLIQLYFQNNIINNFNFPLIVQNPINQITFLQKKRFFENQNLYNNQMLLKENYISNSNIFQLNDFQAYYRPKLIVYSQLIRPGLINDNHYNSNDLGLNIFPRNCLDSIGKENKIENYVFKNTINNINCNLFGNQFNDFLNEKNKLNINYKFNEIVNDNFNNSANDNANNNANINSTDSNNFASLSNKKCLKKKNIFKVNHIKNKIPEQNIITKDLNLTENNNEIKVLKNNKVVYVNNFLLNSYSTSKHIKVFNKVTFIGRNKRSSRYRGVSKNGNQWQVLMMLNKNKSYIGSYPSEEFAARIYDILALKNRGIKARTNFIYTNKQIQSILEKDIDIKAKNIGDIISQLTGSNIL